MDIKSALLSLDKSNAEHWTADGSPRIDVVAALVGVAVKRQEIIDAFPGFTRTSQDEETPESPAEITLEEIITMPVRELMADPEFLTEAIRIADLDAADKAHIMAGAKQESEKAARLASRLREVQMSATKDENPHLEYIRSSNAERARRSSAARSFLNSGTNVADVIKVLSDKAPIDKAFAGRKPGLGTQRPRR